jgi:hypothetical protein
MNRFDLPEITSLLGNFHKLYAVCGYLLNSGIKLESKDFIAVCERATLFCHRVGFEHSSQAAFFLKKRFESEGSSGCDAKTAQAELATLETSILIDMAKHNFVQVDAKVSHYFEANDLYGAKVSKAFPNALADIREAGNCIARELGTAAVFHLMRVVEWGIRALCNNLKITKIKKGHPIEYATWDDLVKELPDVVISKIDNMSRGPKKQKAQEFYHPAIQEISGFKDAYRNHVMHTRKAYTSKDADAISDHVGRFMNLLADYGIRGKGAGVIMCI